MAPDLHLDPDAVVRLAAAARRIADGLPAPPVAPAPGLETRPASEAVAELLAFAVAAERAVRRAREADDAVAHELREVDLAVAHELREVDGAVAHELREVDGAEHRGR